MRDFQNLQKACPKRYLHGTVAQSTSFGGSQRQKVVSVFGFRRPKSHVFASQITVNGRFRVKKMGLPMPRSKNRRPLFVANYPQKWWNLKSSNGCFGLLIHRGTGCEVGRAQKIFLVLQDSLLTMMLFNFFKNYTCVRDFHLLRIHLYVFMSLSVSICVHLRRGRQQACAQVLVKSTLFKIYF